VGFVKEAEYRVFYKHYAVIAACIRRYTEYTAALCDVVGATTEQFARDSARAEKQSEAPFTVKKSANCKPK
jgi:hypothetical protein